MPWGSAKQLAFFKRMADKHGLCGSAGGDVFDFEILKSKHAARFTRAVAAAKKLRERLRTKRARRKGDKWAKGHGFGNLEALEASGWHPAKKRTITKAKKRVPKATGYHKQSKYAKTNPFERHKEGFSEYRG